MFKKVELWILGLICIIFIIVLIAYGSILKHGLSGGNKFPYLYKVAVFLAEVPKNFKNILIKVGIKIIIDKFFPYFFL